MISIIMVNVTRLQCNWLQDAEYNLLLKLIPNETVLFQYSYIEVTTVTAHKELMFLNISKVLNYTLITNCTYISYL